MGLFDQLFKKESVVYAENDIVAVADARIVPNYQISDVMFAEEMLGQTLAFELKNGTIVSPANGTLEVMYPTGHAFAVRMADGTGLLVHVGINTVNRKGNGFKVLKKQGDYVTAGEVIVKVNVNELLDAGYDMTTMLIVTETPSSQKVPFYHQNNVKRGQILNKEK